MGKLGQKGVKYPSPCHKLMHAESEFKLSEAGSIICAINHCAILISKTTIRC